MKAAAKNLWKINRESSDLVWCWGGRMRGGDKADPGPLARFFDSPFSLFLAGLFSWPLLFVALALCAWLGLPHLALYLTMLILSVGFACCELSALDCAQPILPQLRRLLTVFCFWALVGAAGIHLCPTLF